MNTRPAITKAWLREVAQEAGFVVKVDEGSGQTIVASPDPDALPYLRRLLGNLQPDCSQVDPSMGLPSQPYTWPFPQGSTPTSQPALGPWISGTFPPDNRQVVVELQNRLNGRPVYEVARYYRTEPGVHEGPPAWCDNHGNVVSIRRWKFINA